MTYLDYLGAHSRLHTLTRNVYTSDFPRLDSGLPNAEYAAQIEALEGVKVASRRATTNERTSAVHSPTV